MTVPTWLPPLALVVAVILILRAVAIVATKGEGRFRADPFITLMLGFALAILAQYLLQR